MKRSESYERTGKRFKFIANLTQNTDINEDNITYNMPWKQGHGSQTGSQVSSIQRVFQVSQCTWNLELPRNVTAHIQKKLDRGFPKLENNP